MSGVDRLIILGTTLTGLAIVRSAHAAGVDCVMLDIRRGVASLTRLAGTRVVDREQPALVFDALRELAAGRRTALIADSDAWLRFILAHRQAIEAIVPLVLHPDNAALRACLDKNVFLDWCAEHRFPAPKLYTLDGQGGVTPAPEFPLLLRPQMTRHESGLAVPKAVEAKDAASLRDWLARFAAVGVEPSIGQSLLRPGIRQYSIGVARRRDGALRLTVAEKIRSYADQCAGGTYVVLSEQPAVAALCRRVVDAMGYFGIAEVEVMHDDATGESFLIEINARPWTQFALTERAGGDFLRFVLGVETHKPIAAAGRIRWLNFEADAWGCLSRSTGVVRQGRLSLTDYLRSVVTANVFAVWDRRDPWPFLLRLRDFIAARFARPGRS